MGNAKVRTFYWIVGFAIILGYGSKSNAKEIYFQLKRGVGVCKELPTEEIDFKCESIGWPGKDARIDLVRQEFVTKKGTEIRWGLFEFYYFFKGTAKCRPQKERIISDLRQRKNIEELFQYLGKDADCIRKGKGWIQTRNIEMWQAANQNNVPAYPSKKQIKLNFDETPSEEGQREPQSEPGPREFY